MIDCVVSPVLQLLPVVLLDVSVVDCPVQNTNPVLLISGVEGNGNSSVAVAADIAEQPAAPTVTV